MSQKYDKKYKVLAVLLARKIWNSNAAKEFKVPEGTLYGWIKAAKVGELSLGEGNTADVADANTIADELIKCKEELKRLQKENKKLKEEREILADATAFFAKSRLKSE